MNDIQKYLKELHERQEKMKKLREAKEPQVGIIYYIKNELFIDGTPVSMGEPYGDFLNHPTGHSQYWDMIVKLLVRHRGLLELKDFEYDYYPRGRVIYDKKKEEFIIYLDKTLIDKDNLVSEIKEELNLTGQKARLATDSHYWHREK
jgi:hypothetical protein